MEQDDVTFATREWLRLFATYAIIHIAIHALSKLKRVFRSEHVASHVPAPDPTTHTRGGSSHDRQANGAMNGQANGTAYIGTYEALKSQCIPKAPVHMRRAQSFGLDPEELAENIVYDVDGADPFSVRAGTDIHTSNRDGNAPIDKHCDDDDEDCGGPQDHAARVRTGSTATTKKHLRALYRTRDFKSWCVQNKLNSESLQAIFQRMHLYRKLREIHPESFWALCSPESLQGVEMNELGAWTSAAEYLCSRCVDLLAGYIMYSFQADLVASFLSYVLVVRHWAKGRSSCAWMFRAWYSRVDEEALSVGLFRSAVANVLEDMFVVGSFGVGALLSLTGLIFAGVRDETAHPERQPSPVWRQSTGERIAGVRQVRELEMVL